MTKLESVENDLEAQLVRIAYLQGQNEELKSTKAIWKNRAIKSMEKLDDSLNQIGLLQKKLDKVDEYLDENLEIWSLHGKKIKRIMK